MRLFLLGIRPEQCTAQTDLIGPGGHETGSALTFHAWLWSCMADILLIFFYIDGICRHTRVHPSLVCQHPQYMWKTKIIQRMSLLVLSVRSQARGRLAGP
jgi:hypothetical protein